MCGIFGFILKRPLVDSDIELGRKGMECLLHRGPDYSDYWFDQDEGVFLGHTRLSILDLDKRSHQPMIRNGTVLVYNGEIYNYLEVSHHINAKGKQLKTTGDTEVVLESWRKWGRKCVDYFDGMFCFAIYESKKIQIATDPFGEKPIYWAEVADGVYFSSEPGPLSDLLNLKTKLDDDGIAAFLSLGFLPSPKTSYQGMYRMEPGTWIEIAQDGQVKKCKYWSPKEPEVIKGDSQPLSEKQLDIILEAFTKSLKVRLRSDVPIGLFLSSGLDSTLIAAIAAKELDTIISAYTVKFADNTVADESGDAFNVANYLGLPHHIIDSGIEGSVVDPNLIFNLFGEPNDNLTVAAVYQMSTVAKPFLSVALSGIGGDEIFYGYKKYHVLYRWKNWTKLDAGIRNLLSFLFLQGPFSRWDDLGKLLSSSDACRFIAMKNLACCKWLWNIPNIQDWAEMQFSGFGSPLEFLARHFDLTQTMPSTYIPGMERGSMRASLEIRTPFLNKELFDVVSSMDQRALMEYGNKSVIRRILSRYLPEELFKFSKKGFNYPTANFLSYFSTQPSIAGISDKSIEEVWNKRHLIGWQKLSARLIILEHFLDGNNTISKN
tara:strand:+ start:11169 stop:12977 length:1809 start_codon:yes stop_codon:yes gene_type:complete